MNITITRHDITDNTSTFSMSSDKKDAFVSYCAGNGSITVCCKNAAHGVYKGMGRTFFHGWEEAKGAYKSADMKAMIQLVEDKVSVA